MRDCMNQRIADANCIAFAEHSFIADQDVVLTIGLNAGAFTEGHAAESVELMRSERTDGTGGTDLTLRTRHSLRTLDAIGTLLTDGSLRTDRTDLSLNPLGAGGTGLATDSLGTR